MPLKSYQFFFRFLQETNLYLEYLPFNESATKTFGKIISQNHEKLMTTYIQICLSFFKRKMFEMP